MKILWARTVRGMFVISLSLNFVSNTQAEECALKFLAGTWGYSEQGTMEGGSLLTEVGWFQVNSKGTGVGEAFLSVDGKPIPAAGTTTGLPFRVTEIRLDPRNCMGVGTFVPGRRSPRTIVFTLISNTEFHFISTTGDVSILGIAKKRVGLDPI